MTSRIPCSVAILTYNSGKTLARALESVKEFDDLIVCDGGSTDETLSIAKKFEARISTQDTEYKNADGSIADFSGIRNNTLGEAKYDWFLYIDSDECLSKEAVEEIRLIVSTPLSPSSAQAYLLSRITVVQGVCIDCATVYPNYQLRFFHRQATEGFRKKVHEKVVVKAGVRIGKLKHPEFVPLDMTETEYKQKQLRYLAIEAKRHEHDSLWQWLSGPVFGALKSSASYAFRHIRILLFCRGTFMPLWVEWNHHWYNWKLIMLTYAARSNRKKR